MYLPFLSKLFVKKENHSKELIWIYTQCDQCEEKFRTVIRKNHDLASTYQGEKPGFILRKELIGSSCPNRINLTIKFDQNYNRLSEEITGAHFISKEEYESNKN